MVATKQSPSAQETKTHAIEIAKRFHQVSNAIWHEAVVEDNPRHDWVKIYLPIPHAKPLRVVGKSVEEAIVVAFEQIQHLLLADVLNDQWPGKWKEFLEPSITPEKGAPAKVAPAKAKPVERTKESQHTIGVTTSTLLKECVNTLAYKRKRSFATQSRELTRCGLEDFDKRLFTEDPQTLLIELKSDLSQCNKGPTEQWMLRLEPYTAVRLKLTAKEYSLSRSEFSAMCLAHGLKKSNTPA